ncbi:MAG TPA: HAMP domain-containing sensor histidine kinase [Thermoanaerobaculia bacterium]
MSAFQYIGTRQDAVDVAAFDKIVAAVDGFVEILGLGMKRLPWWSLVLLAVAATALLALWAGREARLQRREVEDALRTQAALLANTLGPALASASASARELDELVAWKLLDNARLLARLGTLPDAEIEAIAGDNGLDFYARFDRGGDVATTASPPVDPATLRAELAPLFDGTASELILDAAAADGEGYVIAAVATAGGGVVTVGVDPLTAYAFGGRIGVANLLDHLVASAAVLYLSYRETDGPPVEVSWDGGPVPPEGAATAFALRGRSIFEVTVPVAAPAGRDGALRVGLDGAPLERAAGSALRRTALLGTVLAAFGLASAAFATVQRQRGREREEAARRLAELEENRRRGERLAAAGALAAGLAHEVRNPLNAIAMAAQRLERREVGDAHPTGLPGRIRAEVARLEETLQGFLDLARPAAGPRERFDLAELARDVGALAELEANERGVRLRFDTRPSAVVADRAAVRRALLNLLRNALQASPRDGDVEVAVGSDGTRARFAVRDRGPGVEAGREERLFDAFVTTRADGAGLGLALVRRVAAEHGGDATLANRPDGGVEAVFELPRAEEDR